jgi:DNA end-binding protein Ku
MMRFADELADLNDFSFPSREGFRPAELKMAIQLVENLSAPWDPAKYTDEYVENLMRVIQGKLKGRKPKLVERDTPKQAEVVDLMERLRASLASKDGRQRKGGSPAPRERAAETRRPKKAAKSAGGKRVA